MGDNYCLLMDLERSIKSGHVHYWKPNKMGYTEELRQAGKYSEDEANKIADNDLDKRTVVISQSVIDNIFR